MTRSSTSRAVPGAIANWLFCVAALVVAIVIVGGITRLTESGLSITQWKPISGVIPPLSDAAWQAEFDRYKQIPEYAAFNSDMTIEGFKSIFFWEYLHRLMGRLIGLAFALPLAWFVIRGQVPRGYLPRLIALLMLGALQGTIGWWMVKSGLSERTDVSHLRLALHLMTALFTLGGLVWTALDLRALDRDPAAPPASLRLPALAALVALAVQLMLGAFTAGLDAGYAFSTWPMMGDTLFPAGGWRDGWSALANAVDNPVVVQFLHRWIAFATAAALLWLAAKAIKSGAPVLAMIVGILVVVQIGLGIATLTSGVAIVVAVAHQANAALLVIATGAAAHAIGPRTTSASKQSSAVGNGLGDTGPNQRPEFTPATLR